MSEDLDLGHLWPDAPPVGATVHRSTGRVIPIDGEGRALLMHGFEPARPDWWFWFTLGGAIEEGETSRQAAARELREEAGIDIPEESLGEPVLRETIEWDWGGRHVIQDQEFYALRLPTGTTATLDGMDAGEASCIDRCDWVAVEDLESGAEEPVAPELPRYIRACQDALRDR